MRSFLWASVALACGVLPASAQQEVVDLGEQVYAENCATCHGEKLRAGGSAPDLKLLTPDQKDHFTDRVRNGKGQMPPWDGVISDDEQDAIWAYIRSRAR